MNVCSLKRSNIRYNGKLLTILALKDTVDQETGQKLKSNVYKIYLRWR